MILVEPLPVVDMQLAPAAQIADRLNHTVPAHGDQKFRRRPQDGMTLVLAGFRRIAWDTFNPHPDMSNLPRETVFVGPATAIRMRSTRATLLRWVCRSCCYCIRGS
jgi:hypothetical protein